MSDCSCIEAYDSAIEELESVKAKLLVTEKKVEIAKDALTRIAGVFYDPTKPGQSHEEVLRRMVMVAFTALSETEEK